jgi:hypothetical protein
MTKNEGFENLLKLDAYQVFLFVCPASIPISFGAHTWLVVNKKGAVSRWEMLFWKNHCVPELGHMHINTHPPFVGIEIFEFSEKYRWGARLLKMVEGDQNSAAKRMVEFIEHSRETYPYKDTYRLTGPNSNTYVQWVLDHFPEFDAQLPFNAIGKRFKIVPNGHFK